MVCDFKSSIEEVGDFREPELSPFQELSLLQGVYSLGVVKILLFCNYEVISVATPQIGALKHCQNIFPLPSHSLSECSCINLFSKLLDARYHTTATREHILI
jgi:hypothetical protein